MYKKIFAVYYNFYSLSEGESPQFTSVLLVSLSQFLLCTWLAILFNFYFKINLIEKLSSNWHVYIAIAVIILLNYYYYSKGRVETILLNYAKQPKYEKRIWKVIAWGSLFVMLIMFPIVFTK